MVSRLLRMSLLLLGAAILMAASTTASFAAVCGTTIWNLYAGQTQDVGSLTVSNDETNIYVTYTLDAPDTYFGTLHLWVGNDLLNLPKTPNGTPIPGQFPYQYTPPNTTTTSYTFIIPLNDLAIQDITRACPLTLNVVAHAEVKGAVNETAFGGDQPVNVLSPGRWWYYALYNLCCTVPPPPVLGCETAFAKGGYVFVTEARSNPQSLPSLRLAKNRCGWAIRLNAPGSYAYDIWAGAGLNNLANGTKVGRLLLDWDGSVVHVTYVLSTGNATKELHIYASASPPTTVAPGQYGFTRYFDPATSSFEADLSLVDDFNGVWLVVHSVVCSAS
jgi:hypothetical protein